MGLSVRYHCMLAEVAVEGIYIVMGPGIVHSLLAVGMGWLLIGCTCGRGGSAKKKFEFRHR